MFTILRAYSTASLLILTLVWATSAIAQEEKELLSSAITEAKSITPDLATKDRLNLYESALLKIDTIIQKYGATDIGLALNTSGKYGEFDTNTIRKSYLSELFSYYDKVCETTPSYICLGFVSYKNGTELCQSGKNFNDLVIAHQTLINALVIFKGQDGGAKYASNVISNYRNCKVEAPDYDKDLAHDYFNSQFVGVLLSLGEASRARGLIEQLQNPYYKFNAALQLKRASGEDIDDEYISRLEQYIQEKMMSGGLVSPRQMSLLSLATLAFKSPKVTKVGMASAALNFRNADKFMQDCSSTMPKEAFNLYVNLMFSVYQKFGKDINQTNFLFPMTQCTPQYAIAVGAINRLLYQGQSEQAKEFYNEFSTSDISTDKLKLIDLFIKLSNKPISTGIELPYPMTVQGSEADFAIFKNLVSGEKVCPASKILFTKLKKSSYYVQAINYMTTSPSISPSKKYKCGDEDLELLLK
jgi:hypothetical protein